MQFVSFPEANRNLGAPKGMSPKEVGTLPVYADGQQCISCWQPTEQEREAIAAGLPVYLGVLVSNDPNRPAFTQPPVFMTVGKPSMLPATQAAPSLLTPAYVASLKEIADRLPSPEYANTRPVTGRELRIMQPDLLTPEGNPLRLDQLYFVGGPAIAAQHLEAMSQAYAQGGQPQVVAYLLPYVHFLGSTDAQAAQ
jgi:hypothetical protein